MLPEYSLNVKLRSVWSQRLKSQVWDAATIVGLAVDLIKLLPLYSAFDGIKFQQMYNEYKILRSIDELATLDEKNAIRDRYNI